MAGCLLWAVGLPLGVVGGLLGLTWLLNTLYATAGGRLTISLVAVVVAGAAAWFVLRGTLATVRAVWQVVGGPLLVGLRRARVRPSPLQGSSLGNVPGTGLPVGERPVPAASRGTPQGDVVDADRDDGRSRRWLVRGIVPYGPRGTRRQYVTGIAAKRGTGKSFLLLDLGIALLSGQPWLGWPLRHCASVLYVDLELDNETFAERAEWLARGRRLGAVPAGLHYMDLSGEVLHVPTPQALQAARDLRRAQWGGWGAVVDALAVMGRAAGIENTLTLWGATTQERIVLRARRVRAQAILVDSLTLGGGTAEGDTDGWRRLLKGMEWWGAPVVTLDHSTETGKLAMMGNFAKEGLVRSVLQLAREGKGRLRIVHHKANFAEGEDPFVANDVFHKDAAGRLVAVTFTRETAAPAVPDSASPAVAPVPLPRPIPLPAAAPDTATRLLAEALGGAPAAAAPAATITDSGTIDSDGLRGKAKQHALVLAAFRRSGGELHAQAFAALAAELGWQRQSVNKRCSELKRDGLLEQPEPGLWRLTERGRGE